MGSDWANLHDGILNLVLKRLLVDFPGFSGQPDYLRFSAVCKSWYSVAMVSQDKVDKHPHPMLLIPTAIEGTWKIYNPINDIVLNSQLKLPTKVRFCGYSKGWLIASDETNLVVSLINPSFMVKGAKTRENSIINLPPLDPDQVGPRPDFIVKATISADPMLNPSDCIVAIIYEGDCSLAFIRLNKDTTWTFVDQPRSCVEDVVYAEGNFYSVDSYSRLLSFDTTAQLYSDKELVAHKMMIPESSAKYYLVSLNEKEVLMVQRFITFDNGRRETTKVRIFGLDFDKYEWIEKKTLGDVTLFLGDNFSIHVLALDIPRCQPNCIYFSHDYDRYSSYANKVFIDFGVFNIQNQTFSRSYTRDAKILMEKATQPPIWIAQTF